MFIYTGFLQGLQRKVKHRGDRNMKKIPNIKSMKIKKASMAKSNLQRVKRFDCLKAHG